MSANVKTRAVATQRPQARSGRSRSRGEAVAESWLAQPWSLRVLRAFLGVTFVYAGVNKFADANFFHSGSPGFIGTQLNAFANGSPLAGPLHLLAQNPVFTGVAIAFTEIAIGVGTLFGIAPVLFASGGFAVNLGLTMSATWHVHPYFLGSDSMYAVGWAAYAVGLVEMELRRRRATVSRGARVRETGQIGRREVLRGGVLAGATILVAGVAKAVAGSPTASALSSGLSSGSSGSSTGASQGPSAAGGGTVIADLAKLPVGQAVGFEAPGVGPAALIRLGTNDVVAFSRTCTHAGCLVGYDPSSRILVCPCHGARYDPANGAAVIAGPAPAPLPPVAVAIHLARGLVVLS